MENKKVKYKIQITEIDKIKLDFDKLKEWKDPENDGLPIYGFASFYKACGLTKILKEYSTLHENMQFVAFDNLVCNFKTVDKIKNLIKNNWSEYSLQIKEDGHVTWDTKKWEKGKRHYKKTLSEATEANLKQNFANYCPQFDEDVEDDNIIFQVYEKIYEEKEDEKNPKSV